MNEAYGEFARRRAGVLAVGFEPPEHLAAWQPIRPLDFPVVVDPDRALYRSVGAGRVPLRRLLTPRVIRYYWRLYRRWGMPRKPRDDPWQLGGDLWVDRRGHVLWVHLSRDPTDRPSPQQLLGILDRECGPWE